MKKLELEQGSDAWLAARKTKVTASEIPIILGKSKWSTPLLLWQRKLGFAPLQEDNPAMRRGRELEPVVRDEFNDKMGRNFTPAVVLHEDLEWAMASLDGIDGEEILEIKCPGLKDHQVAQKGKVPEHYKDQLQWQLFCSGKEKCYYVSYHETSTETVIVERDDDYIADVMLPAAAEFYRCLVVMEEPKKDERDYIQIVDPEFEQLAKEYIEVKESFDVQKEILDTCKEKLVSMSDDSNCRGYGVSLRRVSRDGSINWKKLWAQLTDEHPELAEEFEPETYRAKTIGYWKVSVDGEK